MGDYFDAGKHGAVLAIPFSHANVTTGESNTDLTAGQDTLHVMPYSGSIIGISIRANASLTAGTITAQAHSNSTEVTDTGAPAPACSSSAQVSYATVRPGAVTFSAGDKLGISVTTTTTLDPTNSVDVDALLFVQLDPN